MTQTVLGDAPLIAPLEKAAETSEKVKTSERGFLSSAQEYVDLALELRERMGMLWEGLRQAIEQGQVEAVRRDQWRLSPLPGACDPDRIGCTAAGRAC